MKKKLLFNAGLMLIICFSFTAIKAQELQTFVKQISASSDDAEETKSSGVCASFSSDIELDKDLDFGSQLGALRFTDIVIPKNATIVEAHIQFTSKSASDPANPVCNVSFFIENSDNAATFIDGTDPQVPLYQLSSRITHVDSVNWSVPEWLTANEAAPVELTPNLNKLLQSVVNRNGWSSGNAVCFIIDGPGTGWRNTRSFDANSTQAATLNVTYTVVPENKAPVANAGPDQSIDGGNVVTLDGSASSDPDGNTLTYQWTASNGIILSSSTDAKPTFTAPESNTDTQYTFSLVVNDGQVNSPADEVVISCSKKQGSVLVSSVEISGENNATTITSDNGTLQMQASILPLNADIQTVEWSVLNGTGKATISSEGMLTALDNGTVTVIADATDGSLIHATAEITISGQNYTFDERNIIVNGTFSTNDAWYGNINIVNGVGEMAPDKVYPHAADAGVIEDMKLAYDKRDMDYIFSLTIWSEQNRSLVIMMQDNNNDYTKYGISTDPESNGQSYWTIEQVPTTPTVYTFHVNFKNMLPNCSQSLIFAVGTSTSKVYVDNVSLMTVADFETKVSQIDANTLKVYPNPIGEENELNVIMDKVNEKVAIFNSVGQKMMEKIANGNIAIFNVSSLSKGIYIIRLSNGTSRKFIK